MKSATIAQLKKELQQRSPEELLAVCLRLAKFKQENKELLTYLLFDATDEEEYIRSVKEVIVAQLATVNTKNYYWMRKGVRKALKEVKKYIRYSQRKETEIELLLAFCRHMHTLRPSIFKDQTLHNIYNRQLEQVRKAIGKLHEDLQFDYTQELLSVENV